MRMMMQPDDRKKFYCREWALQKLAHCLDQRCGGGGTSAISKPAGSSCCGALLLGGPGCGKTTLCAELCWPSQGPAARQQRALNRRLLGHHFLQGHNEKSLSLSEFVRSLVTQILNHSTESHKERSMRKKLANNLISSNVSASGDQIQPSSNQQSRTDDSETDYSLNKNTSCDQSLIDSDGVYSNVLSEIKHLNTSTDISTPPIIIPTNPRTLIADAYLDKLKNDPEIQIALRAKNIELNPDDCLKRALLFPLLEIDPPKTSLFILIDSIDEHSFIYSNSTLTRSRPKERSCSQSKTIAELLANHHHLLPQWLMLVCTARKQSKSIAKMFTGFRKMSLDDLRKTQVVRDVQQYILARLDQENSLRQHISRDTAEMLNQLHIKSNGCFLYLEKVLDGVADNFIVLREVREIPGTLNGLYLWLCQRLFNRRQFAKVQPLLNVILAAKCALNESLLYDIIRIYNNKISVDDFRKRFLLLKRILVISRTGTIRLFHHSFTEWLLDIKHCTQKYLCNIFHGHSTLAMYYTLHAVYLNNQEIYDYAFHLTRMEQYLSENPEKTATNLLRMSQDRRGVYLGDRDKGKGVGAVKVAAIKEEAADLKSPTIDGEKAVVPPFVPIYAEVRKLHKTTPPTPKPLSIPPISTLNSSPPTHNENNQATSLSAATPAANSATPNQQSSAAATAASSAPAGAPSSIIGVSGVLDVHTLTQLWLIVSGCNVQECLLEGSETAGVNFGAYLPTDPKVLKLLIECGAVEQAATVDGDGCAYESQISLATTSTEPSPEPLFDLHDIHGQAALHVAARLGQAHVVKIMLESGANIDQADMDGWTPLRAAAWGGHTEVVELLVEHGCSLDSMDAENRTALRAAAWSGHEEIVRILLQHGANVNLTDHEGRTALIAAAYMGHADIVDLLLIAGAEVNHADADGRTALSVAALCAPRNSPPPGAGVVATLLQHDAAVDHKDNDGMTPLLVAAFEGHKDVCELLLEHEADVDHVDHAGRSPLWAAASMGHAPVVAILLFWGCCIDAMDAEGRTVLSVAAAQGCVEVVSQLLDRGLDEQHRDNSGWTPLHYAAFEGHQDVCEALLTAGARIDEPDNEGKPPLSLAAQSGHTSLVSLLLSKFHAPPDQRPHDGKTALRLAALDGHYDVVQQLLRHGADSDVKDADGRSTLYVLALDNRLGMAKYVVREGGADVETRDLEGRTPLHVSSWQGHTEMVQLLLTVGGARVDATDHENRTALHSASWQGHSDIVQLLLENGAAPDHTCNQGATALGIAAQEGHELCVVALLQHGADPNHSDACGRTAVRVAAKSGHRGVVRLLEEHTALHKPPQHHNIHPHTSSSANSITSGSTAETKPSGAILYASGAANGGGGNIDWAEQQQRRSMVSLGNHSSNSKSSSNLTGSSHSSRHGDKNINTTNNSQPMSFTQQLQQCTRGGKTRPLSKLLSPLQSEPQSPIYASPPLSPIHDTPNMFGGIGMNIYQPVLRHNNFAKAPDTHFARDTHMRIILGNSSAGVGATGKGDKKSTQDNSNSQSNSKPKRNGIVTNPALRLVGNIKNGLDTAAANLRKSTSSSNPATKTNSFHWRKETPL